MVCKRNKSDVNGCITLREQWCRGALCAASVTDNIAGDCAQPERTLACDNSHIAADADCKVNNLAKLRCGGLQQRRYQNGQKIGIRYIEIAQKIAISGMPTFMKSVKR